MRNVLLEIFSFGSIDIHTIEDIVGKIILVAGLVILISYMTKKKK